MIRSLIVDDSPLAIELLESYITRVPFLELVKKCSTALEAAQFMKSGNIDLLFLDIQMPDFTGIELLKSLTVKPKVIFTNGNPYQMALVVRSWCV